MHITTIKQLIQPELTKVMQLLNSSASSNIALTNEIIAQLINGKGKMIRPIVNILCAHLCKYPEQEHIKLSAAIELIHSATLLHDDVIDNAKLRRGVITTNYKWGNEHAVLAGDFLLAKAAQLIANINNAEILGLFAATTTTIAEGEMLQLTHRNNLNINETTYLTIISQKTAKLFETAALATATLINCSPEIKTSLANYGLHFGIALQLVNDLLDYQTTNHQEEPACNDIQQGNITLPVIYLLSNGAQTEKNLIQEIIKTQDKNLLPLLQLAIASSGAIAYTIDLAKKEATLAKQALSEFVNSAYKTTAIKLLDVVIANKT